MSQTVDRATRVALAQKAIESIRVSPAPPVGFKPLEATPEELKLYGIPTKPDETAEPERYKEWSKHVSGTHTFVSPEFTIIERNTNGPVQNASAPKNSASTSTNWSGVVNTTPPSGTWTSVAGYWNVPNAAWVASAGGTQWVAVWVGLDGWGNSDVLQAGTDTYVSQGSSATVWPWYEWYPQAPIGFNNLNANVGDQMYCEVTATSSTGGSLYFKNITSGVYTAFTFSPPAGTTCSGITAEWIVEDPGIPTVPFPNYGSVNFTGTYAYSGSTWYTPGGTSLTLVQNGVTLSQPSNVTNNSFTVSYV